MKISDPLSIINVNIVIYTKTAFIMSSLQLSACIIAKNAEETLEECITSIQKHSAFTQIVVVDTGSTDSTAIIASCLNAEVYFFSWQNDFSAARNFGIRCCRNEWILMIDADEQILKFPIEQLGGKLCDPTIGGIEVSIVNSLDSEHRSRSTHRSIRLFRNNPDFFYQFCIHEQISQSIINAGYHISPSPIALFHRGYEKISAEKIARNKHLLEKELAQSPDDAFFHYHLGLTEFADGNFTEAQKHFELALQYGNLTGQQEQMIKVRLGQIALKENKFAEAQEILNFTATDQNLEGLRRYLLAVTSLYQGNLQLADQMLNSVEVHTCTFINSEDRVQLQQILTKLQELEK